MTTENNGESPKYTEQDISFFKSELEIVLLEKEIKDLTDTTLSEKENTQKIKDLKKRIKTLSKNNKKAYREYKKSQKK